MATLSIPHSFVPGTPALASEVNANFQAVVSWTQGQISTDNLGILGARSVALPSSPTLAILSLAQTSSNIALNISNSGTESAIAISQSGALANGKGAILINSPSNQTTSGAAELLMTLNTNSSIPAILVKHGAVETMSLSRTQLNLFNNIVQVTSAGVFSATTVNATTVGATTANLTNANTTGLITATAPVSDAIAIKVKGRSSDNNAIVQFKSNNDATLYASATSSSSGLSFNLPDTADSYSFLINGVTKISCADAKTEIAGRTDGTSVTSGYIGQTITVQGANNISQNGTSGNPLTFTSGPSLSLTAGVWMVMGTTRIGELSGGAEGFYGQFRISSSGTLFGFGGPQFFAGGGASITVFGVVSLTASQTIQFYFVPNGIGTPVAGLGLPNMPCGFIQAVRIG